jgi:hypothetical protein
MNQTTTPTGRSCQHAGIALLVFTCLLLFTMVLHPAGGNVHRLITLSTMIIITHAVGILALPVGWAGFYGLAKRLGTDQFMVVTGFAFMSIGLIAAMLAGSTNGLILPLFLRSYVDAGDDVLNTLQPVIRYSFTVNKAFDYVYTGAFCLAILCWSQGMIRKKIYQRVGWLGIILSLAMLIAFFGGLLKANSLSGLRIFLSGVLLWIMCCGMEMVRERSS